VGLNVYERENKLTPTVTFTYSEIRHISFDDKKFVLRTVDKNSSNFVFYSKKVRMNKFVSIQSCIVQLNQDEKSRRDRVELPILAQYRLNFSSNSRTPIPAKW